MLLINQIKLSILSGRQPSSQLHSKTTTVQHTCDHSSSSSTYRTFELPLSSVPPYRRSIRTARLLAKLTYWLMPARTSKARNNRGHTRDAARDYFAAICAADLWARCIGIALHSSVRLGSHSQQSFVSSQQRDVGKIYFSIKSNVFSSPSFIGIVDQTENRHKHASTKCMAIAILSTAFIWILKSD